jgi:hypothetical protein
LKKVIPTIMFKDTNGKKRPSGEKYEIVCIATVIE